MNAMFVHDALHLVDDAATRLVALQTLLDADDPLEAQHHLTAALQMLETALKRMEQVAA